MSAVLDYPPELLFIICSHIYAAGLPSSPSSLDPVALGQFGAPTALPSTIPPGHWPEPSVRKTLSNLCLVNRAWYEAAKPWLWRRVEVRLPRSWLALVDEITGGEDGQSVEKTALAVEKSIQAVAELALATTAMAGASSDEEALKKWKESILETLTGPDGSVPPEILTPPASRDPSPRRLRAKSKSPARWKIMRTISDAVQDIADRNEFGLYVPRVHDPRPGRFVQYIDFNHFRTIGMRRSVEEGVSSRFVTGERVEALLKVTVVCSYIPIPGLIVFKEMPNLTAFGATEYMDGALTLPVLNELFLRGVSARIRGKPSRGRGLVTIDYNGIDEDDRERRRDCKQLEAVDFTGCISAVFVSALAEFVNTHLSPTTDESTSNEDDSRREERRARRTVRFTEEEDPLTFAGVRRLCLRGVKSVQPHVLNPFVLAFPSLTHLDLSATRVTPELLTTLAKSATVQLHSLSLARCIRLTGESIKTFLIHAPAAARIQELSLYGDQTFPSPLSAEDLEEMFTLAPCFTSGELTYLDLSSSPVSAQLLHKCKSQPNLRSLGLSYIPNLELEAIAEFVKSKANNVEVLTLISTSPSLDWSRTGGIEIPRDTVRQTSLALHTKIITPLCMPPRVSLFAPPPVVQPVPTRLRVIELSMPALVGLGGGAGTWRTIRSKGGRGWYVDTATGWVGGRLVRGLTSNHLLRVEMNRLADANGNVNSGIGWHARKMEVLHGFGMLGREDGLYGAVSFAYQG
ncbi:hypothetical protein ID866_8768 [Astraeus odoratus]|nr:hypothetical protein ID866_8768 [Astraeus odoratus]